MAVAIILSVVAVTLEANHWSFWGDVNTVTGKQGTPASQDDGAQSVGAGTAFAMPLQPTKGDGLTGVANVHGLVVP